MAYQFHPNMRRRASWATHPTAELNPWCNKRDAEGKPLLEFENGRLKTVTWDTILMNDWDYPLLPGENSPLYFRTVGIKQPADMSVNRVVSEKFKTLIESFEPGLHEFYHIHLLRGSKRSSPEWPGKYYLLRIRKSLSAVMARESGLKWCARNYNLGPYIESRHSANLVLNKQMITGHHLWMQKKQGPSGPYFASDQFHQACKEAGIGHLQWAYCAESDEPWSPIDTEIPADDDPVWQETPAIVAKAH